MEWLEQVRTAADSIRANKLRSVLTMLGVIIGVASVILLVSIGEGMRMYLSDTFAGMGSNLLLVFPGKQTTTGHGRTLTSVRRITLEDAQALRKRSLSVAAVSAVVLGSATVSKGALSRDVLVIGTDEYLSQVHNLSLATGEFIKTQDVWDKHRVALIGQTIALELFGESSALGQLIKISDSRFRVIGVIAKKGQSVGMEFDDVVYIPVTTAMELFEQNGISRISIKAANKFNLEPAIEDIRTILMHRHNHREDFTIVSQEDLLMTFNRIAQTMTWVLLGIACISLLVGGIGIMNIMLVSVRERTREIGIRKAVGAKNRDILTQFLFESICISILGGIIGIFLGSGIALGVHYTIPEIPIRITLWMVALAFCFSVAVGVFFGVAPAKKAAALDPIESLRYE